MNTNSLLFWHVANRNTFGLVRFVNRQRGNKGYVCTVFSNIENFCFLHPVLHWHAFYCVFCDCKSLLSAPSRCECDEEKFQTVRSWAAPRPSRCRPCPTMRRDAGRPTATETSTLVSFTPGCRDDARNSVSLHSWVQRRPVASLWTRRALWQSWVLWFGKYQYQQLQFY